jgi:1-acyl-sn-glycerol-3-phosphate acyltransferase
MKQDTQAASDPAEQAIKPANGRKPKKNLYEPYVTPRIAWEMVRALFHTAMFIVAHVHVRGRYNIPRKGPYIVASNHLSWIDIPFIPAYIPGRLVWMAKEEVFQGKLGWIGRFLGAFPVKRGEGDRQALRTAEAQLKKGNVLGIFPEGHRSDTHSMIKGHAGLGMIALRTGMPVLPVAVWGTENVLREFGAHANITFGEPIVLKPKGEKITREDIEAATETVMRRIASMLPPQYRGVYGDDSA